MNKLTVALARAVSAVIVVFISAASLHALTPSGTQITTSCTAGYKNTAGTSMPSVTSNTVTLTVSQLGGVQITPVVENTAAQPGSSGYVCVTIKNAGNGTDSFGLTAGGASTWSPKMIVDTNGDGIHQSTETTTVTTTPSLAAGASYKCFLAVTVPTSTTTAGSFTLASTSKLDSTKAAQGTYALSPLAKAVSSVTVTPPMIVSGDTIKIQVTPAANTSFNKVVANGLMLTQSGTVWTGQLAVTGTLGSHPITVTATDSIGNSAHDSIASYKMAPVVMANVRSAHDPIMSKLSGSYIFRYCGKVKAADSANLDIDDGSGSTVRVNAAGYSGIKVGDFITARGILTPSSSLPLLSSAGAMVGKL